MIKRHLCPLCDAWYTDAEAAEHDHPEPQGGPMRDHWLASGLPYDRWIAETDEGRDWQDFKDEEDAP